MAKDYWETPIDVVHALANYVKSEFTLDVACEPHNAKAPVSLIDAFAQPWDDMGGFIYCNPPYSNPGPWADRFAGGNVNGVMLVNAATSAKWFHTAMTACDEMLIPDNRIAFYDPDRGTIANGNDRSQVIFVFRKDSRRMRLVSVPIERIQPCRDKKVYANMFSSKHNPRTTRVEMFDAELDDEL